VDEKKRRTTGITGLDFPLEGGFPIGTSIIGYGHPLSGVDLMAKQFWKPETAEEKEESVYMILDEDASEEMIDAKELSLGEIAKNMKGSRIIIDSLSRIMLIHGNDKALDFMRNEVREVLKKGANVMLTLYKDLHKEEDMILLMRSADIFIELDEKIQGNEIERTFWIRKIKGQKVPQRVIPFLITEKGLELSTTSRVV
jgi:KaiC/GvpD/RAD55 family RecA-like ATPase